MVEKNKVYMIINGATTSLRRVWKALATSLESQ